VVIAFPHSSIADSKGRTVPCVGVSLGVERLFAIIEVSTARHRRCLRFILTSLLCLLIVCLRHRSKRLSKVPKSGKLKPKCWWPVVRGWTLSAWLCVANCGERTSRRLYVLAALILSVWYHFNHYYHGNRRRTRRNPNCSISSSSANQKGYPSVSSLGLMSLQVGLSRLVDGWLMQK
jgi:hypothetical protein